MKGHKSAVSHDKSMTTASSLTSSSKHINIKKPYFSTKISLAQNARTPLTGLKSNKTMLHRNSNLKSANNNLSSFGISDSSSTGLRSTYTWQAPLSSSKRVNTSLSKFSKSIHKSAQLVQKSMRSRMAYKSHMNSTKKLTNLNTLSNINSFKSRMKSKRPKHLSTYHQKKISLNSVSSKPKTKMQVKRADFPSKLSTKSPFSFTRYQKFLIDKKEAI